MTSDTRTCTSPSQLPDTGSTAQALNFFTISRKNKALRSLRQQLCVFIPGRITFTPLSDHGLLCPQPSPCRSSGHRKDPTAQTHSCLTGVTQALTLYRCSSTIYTHSSHPFTSMHKTDFISQWPLTLKGSATSRIILNLQRHISFKVTRAHFITLSSEISQHTQRGGTVQISLLYTEGYTH